MQMQESFLRRVEEAMEAHGISARALGWEALGDPSFVIRLRRRQHSTTLKTIEKVEAFIAKLEAKRKRGKAA
jgi:hypothetical protein